MLLEAFKGDQYDYRVENSAKNWATAYDFPAVKDGRVVKEEFTERASGRMQAFVFNLRRAKFQDPRVRRAFNLAFDFEEMNKHDLLRPVQPHRQLLRGTELASRACREGREQEILESVQGQGAGRGLHDRLHEPGNGDADDGARQPARGGAAAEARPAGSCKGGKLRRTPRASRSRSSSWATTRPASATSCPTSPRWSGSASRSSLRLVDPSQYQNRMRAFDFDMTTIVWGQSLSPGNEQRDFWGSDGRRPARLAEHRSASRIRASTR